jgi:hypothetical protein
VCSRSRRKDPLAVACVGNQLRVGDSGKAGDGSLGECWEKGSWACSFCIRRRLWSRLTRQCTTPSNSLWLYRIEYTTPRPPTLGIHFSRVPYIAVDEFLVFSSFPRRKKAKTLFIFSKSWWIFFFFLNLQRSIHLYFKPLHLCYCFGWLSRNAWLISCISDVGEVDSTSWSVYNLLGYFPSCRQIGGRFEKASRLS